MASLLLGCIFIGLMINVYCHNFGFNNYYTCHCLNDSQCNVETGACNNGCSIQWVGPSCQQENIAYKKQASQFGQVGNQGPGLAVDGNRQSDSESLCTKTDVTRLVWWNVNIGQKLPLRYFKIYYRSDSDRLSSFKGFEVAIDDPDKICYNHTGGSDLPAVIPIECNKTIIGNFITVRNIKPDDPNNFLTLCEVEVYVCSLGTYGSDCNNFCHCSNYDKCDVKTGKCPNGCQIGWDGDSCNTKCKESYGKDCSKKCTDRNCSGISTCDHVTGQCINGCKPGYQGIDCKQECQGSYGLNCSKQCSDRNCLDQQSSCNNIDGKCIGGCQAGYRPLDCTQKCQGSYGENCNKQCSDRNCLDQQSSCNNIDGKCIGGCQAGYTSLDCTQKCQGNYGLNCSKQCSDRNCLDQQSSCNNIDGKCIGGCQAGYTPLDCTQICGSGFYGLSCNSSCSERFCKNFTTCHHETGACGQDGCLDNYDGVDCTGCADGYYGYTVGCNKSCSERNCSGVNSSCDKVNGRCDDGCLEGFNGIDCSIKKAPLQVDNSQTTTIAVAVSVVALLLVVIAVIAFIIWRRRRPPPDDTHDDILVADKKKDKTDENTYENVDVITRDEEITNATPTLCSTPPLEADNVNVDVQSAEVVDEKNCGVPGDDIESSVYLNENDSEALKISELEDYVVKLRGNNGFKEMFTNLPVKWVASYDASQIPKNRPKNRFKGYYPYDHTRVKMKPIPGDPHSDYINANYIDGYVKKKQYIAAQGATKVTINDFVRMIWDQKCDKVIMLTNLMEMGKHKCEQYWPTEQSEVFGDLNLTLMAESVRANYTIRTIGISKGNDNHTFYQYHYTSWPDHDVPEVNDLLDFLYTVNKRPPHSDKPDIVHCSAGVGRTGTYIAIDICLQDLKKTGTVHVIKCITNLRKQRKGMVQTSSQLQFVFEALIEGFQRDDTSMYLDVFQRSYSKEDTYVFMGNNGLKAQFEYLKSLQSKKERNQIYINDKIMTYTFPSHVLSKGYFFNPLKNVTNDLIWETIFDSESPVTVFIIDNTNKMILCPEVNTEETFGDITVENLTDERLTNQLNVMKVKVSIEGESQTMTVLILDIDEHRDITTISSYMLQVIEQLDVYMNHLQPITMFTSDLKYSQLFCILRNIQQRIKLDNEVEIFSIVKKIHLQIGKTITSLDDYNRLHQFALEYIISSSTYANL